MATATSIFGTDVPSIDDIPVFTLAGSSNVQTSDNGTGVLGFQVSDTSTKLSEASSNITSTFGSTGSFDKLYATGNSFTSELAAAQLAGAANITLPTVQVTASQAKAAAQNVSTAHLVVLKEIGTQNVVQFDVMPSVQEMHSISYEPVKISQGITSFQKFIEKEAVTWTLDVKFISRTPDEATRNLTFLKQLRGWTMPFFGKNTDDQYPGKLGAPPPTLELSGLRGLIGTVPVIIQGLQITWPSDVDYIPTAYLGIDNNPVPFPTVMSFALPLTENWSTKQVNTFNLGYFRDGNIAQAFGGKAQFTLPSSVTSSVQDLSVSDPTTTTDVGTPIQDI